MAAHSGNRMPQPQRGWPFVVRTIDLRRHPKPAAYADLSYGMSRPAPVEDPCAYAASCLRGPAHTKMVFRIERPLEPTYAETEAGLRGRAPPRTVRGDPAFVLAENEVLDAFVQSMAVGGVAVTEYEVQQAARALRAPRVAADVATPDTTMITPQKRSLGAQQPSTAKRQRTVRVNTDGDVSMDAVQSVLRMIDDSLVDTPERQHVATPRVLRAAPGPSPRQHGPTYAYDPQSQFDGLGGLAPRPYTAQTPWLGQRIMRV